MQGGAKVHFLFYLTGLRCMWKSSYLGDEHVCRPFLLGTVMGKDIICEIGTQEREREGEGEGEKEREKEREGGRERDCVCARSIYRIYRCRRVSIHSIWKSQPTLCALVHTLTFSHRVLTNPSIVPCLQHKLRIFLAIPHDHLRLRSSYGFSLESSRMENTLTNFG